MLLGDGMDSRPFRLPWPPGTLLYVVAPPEVHELAEAVLSQAEARVPRGCLLRRVNADLQHGGSIINELERAGFRADRLSVWALQVRRAAPGARSRARALPAAAARGLRVENGQSAAGQTLKPGSIAGLSCRAVKLDR